MSKEWAVTKIMVYLLLFHLLIEIFSCENLKLSAVKNLPEFS